MTSRPIQSKCFLLCFSVIALLASGSVLAQDGLQTQTLIDGKTSFGFEIAPEVKFSSVNGRYAQFMGLRAGLVINHRLTIGVGGYTNATGYLDYGMSYGGIFAEYLVDSQGPIGFSVGGLLGGGTAHQLWSIPSWRRGGIFSVAEPQVKLSVNVSKWFRLCLGGGYRFALGADGNHAKLNGPTAGVILSLGRF